MEGRVAYKTVEPVTFYNKRCTTACNNIILGKEASLFKECFKVTFDAQGFPADN